MSKPGFHDRSAGERVGRQLAETKALRLQALETAQKWDAEHTELLRRSLGQLVYMTGRLHSTEKSTEDGIERETFIAGRRGDQVRLPLGWYVVGELDMLHPNEPLLMVSGRTEPDTAYCVYVNDSEYPEPPRRPQPYPSGD